jgi:thiol-disulfide isomerase/thioredoxin
LNPTRAGVFGVAPTRCNQTPQALIMKSIPFSPVLGLLAVGAISVSLPTSAATLKVGDRAPSLQVSKWVQGEPVKAWQKDSVYVVEFWATWCGPCKVSIPHLNELHTQFKDKGLVVIGQDCWEQDVNKVEPFVKNMGEKMTYRVALDDVSDGKNDRGKMATTWMEAAGQNGIPTAFVVNQQGRIAWIGHPMGLKAPLLESVLDGSYDLKKATTEYEQKQKKEEEMNALYQDLNKSMQAKNWEAADATVSQIEKLLPEAARDNMGMTRFRILLGRQEYKAAYALARKLSDAHQDNPILQNQLAQRANEAVKGKDAAILDTLARVLFLKGQKAEAIEHQEKAVELASGQMKEQLAQTLASYKEGKVPKAE